MTAGDDAIPRTRYPYSRLRPMHRTVAGRNIALVADEVKRGGHIGQLSMGAQGSVWVRLVPLKCWNTTVNSLWTNHLHPRSQPLISWTPTIGFLCPGHCFPGPRQLVPWTPTIGFLDPNPWFSEAPAIGFLDVSHLSIEPKQVMSWTPIIGSW